MEYQGQNLKEISVIITAHDRTKYLNQAINSVINQTINKSRYEVIVIKNFKSKEIDELIEREGFINIDANQNSKIGEDLYLGLINSHSDIICFLDDDDVFNETKLENVLKVFSRDPSLSLYVNARAYANEDLTKIYHKAIGYDIESELYINDNQSDLLLLPILVNMSSICIKKKVLTDFLIILNKINFSPDDFMLFVTLCNQGKIYRDSKRLTIYRMHESSSQANAAGDLEKFLFDKRKILELRITTYSYFKDVFKNCRSALLKVAIEFSITDVKINLAFSTYNNEYNLSLNEIMKYHTFLMKSFLSLITRRKVERKKIFKFFLWYEIKFFIILLIKIPGSKILIKLWNRREYNLKKAFLDH